jgi:hypothetical protein
VLPEKKTEEDIEIRKNAVIFIAIWLWANISVGKHLFLKSKPLVVLGLKSLVLVTLIITLRMTKTIPTTSPT